MSPPADDHVTPTSPSLQALDALDAATAAITAELSVERVLQVIVDQVRPLVGARYAALGIVGERGRIDRFITTGMDAETRRAIGHPPRGHGILGVIIHDGTSLRLRDLTAHPRSSGFPPNHPPMHTFLGVPVRVEGRSIGNLYLTDKDGGQEFSPDDQRLVEMFARHAGIAIHNARLHEGLEDLAILRERERIGQDLHDGIIQSLYAVGLSLEDAAELMADDPEEGAARIERAIDSIHAAIRDIRRFIFGLRPELLDDVGLAGGLEVLADQFRRATRLTTELTLTDAPEVDAEDAAQLLQLAREALSNAARHADATAVRIGLDHGPDWLRITITDDGTGFDPAVDHGPGHRGLHNMRTRAEAMGGMLSIDSGPTDGTRVIVQVPLGQDARSQGAAHDRRIPSRQHPSPAPAPGRGRP
jgi:signal transduction histidine kinase